MQPKIAPPPLELSAENSQAEQLSAAVMGHLIEMANVADTDPRTTCLFLLSEVFAHLEVYADTPLADAVDQVRDLTAERCIEIREFGEVPALPGFNEGPGAGPHVLN